MKQGITRFLDSDGVEVWRSDARTSFSDLEKSFKLLKAGLEPAPEGAVSGEFWDSELGVTHRWTTIPNPAPEVRAEPTKNTTKKKKT